uniref:Uncharacterized protein n=1 Tax=Arundo donax TaxID=35708 RepID=A0A0A9GLY5_ARUDO
MNDPCIKLVNMVSMRHNLSLLVCRCVSSCLVSGTLAVYAVPSTLNSCVRCPFYIECTFGS